MIIKRQIIIATCALLIILGGGSTIYFAKQNRQPGITQAAETDIPEMVGPSQSDQPKEQTLARTADEPRRPETDLSSLSFPILMYHHIRDFQDPDDKIGANLSVSPQKFSDQLDLIQRLGYETITFDELRTGIIPEKPIILTFDDGYQNFYDNAYPEIKKRQMKAVVYVITGRIGNDGYVTENQIKELSLNGIEIGAHTISHPDLTKISPEKAAREINESREVLSNLINKSVVSFCYPAGVYDQAIISLVESAGYLFAATTKSGLAEFINPYELQRRRVNSDTAVSGYLK